MAKRGGTGLGKGTEPAQASSREPLAAEPGASMAMLAMPLPSIGIPALALPNSSGESAAIGTALPGIGQCGWSTVIPSCNQNTGPAAQWHYQWPVPGTMVLGHALGAMTVLAMTMLAMTMTDIARTC